MKKDEKRYISVKKSLENSFKEVREMLSRKKPECSLTRKKYRQEDILTLIHRTALNFNYEIEKNHKYILKKVYKKFNIC